jgi:tripartite-type tricarboxylate transporter receptor subunit TctC
MVDQSLKLKPQIKAGTINVFGVAHTERLASQPDVPTAPEAGDDFVFSAWNAMVAPKGTPKEIVDKLADALSRALDDPAVQARYVELGSSAPKGADRGPAGLQKLVESEVARITPVIKAAGVTAQYPQAVSLSSPGRAYGARPGDPDSTGIVPSSPRWPGQARP